MISAQTSTTPIKIGLLEASPENKAVLAFYFKSHGAELFKQVNPENAEAFLFDYDLAESKDHWEKLHQETNKPGIAISNTEISLPNTVWLKTPLTPEALSQAANAIRAYINTEDLLTNAPSFKLEPETINTSEPEFSLELIPQDETEKNPPDQSESASEDIVTVKAGKTTEYTGSSLDSQIDKNPDVIDSLLDSLNSDVQARKDLKTIQDTTQENKLEPILDAKIAEESKTEAPEDDIDNLLNALNEDETSNIEIISEERLSPIEGDSVNEPSLFNEDIITTAVDDEELEELEIEVIPEIINTSSTSNISSDQEDSSGLQAMLDEIQLEMVGNSSVPIKNLDDELGNSNTEVHHDDYEAVNTPDRWELLCGDVNSIKNAAGIKKNAYKLKDHLLSYLLDTVKKAKKTNQGMRIKYDDVLLLIDPELDTIYSDTSLYSDEYTHVCFTRVDHDFVKVHTLDLSESRMLHKKLETEPENAYSIESFLWTSTLLTSRGRLLKHTNTNTIVGLKKWPTLKTLEPFPHVTEIAVKFSREDSNLLEISKSMNIPQCYVFTFYNAAICLDKLNLDSEVIDKNNIKKISFGFKSKKKADKSKGASKKKGFFSRFLKKG